MDEVKRVISYIRSCRESGIDVIITIDKSRSHLILNALMKQIPMEVRDVHVDEYYCPACGSENNCDQGVVDDDFCPRCGQAIYQQNCNFRR